MFDEKHINLKCKIIHEILETLPEYDYKTPISKLPTDGIYFFYEDGEFYRNGIEKRKRIVRVGTHRVDGNFRSRINNHYKGNKNSSVFRKHLGGALIRKKNPDDKRLNQWLEQDAPTFQEIENDVSNVLKGKFRFKCIPVEDRQERLGLEEQLIATLSNCPECSPSEKWIGAYAASEEIRSSGLWNTQHVSSKNIITENEIERIKVLSERFNSKEKRALFLIPCCSEKKPSGDNPPWKEIRLKQNLNRLQFLDDYRVQLIHFYSNLSKGDASNYYKNRGSGETRNRKVGKAWQKNLGFPNCKTMKAIERYNGKLYSALCSDIKEQLRSGRIDNVLIVSALMGIITPTDLIPDYELMMTDKSPKKGKISEFWKTVYAIDNVKQPLREIFSKFNYIYCLMSDSTGYVPSVSQILSEYKSYHIKCPEANQNAPRIWGRVLNDVLLNGISSPDGVRKMAEKHNCKMVELNTPKRIAMGYYKYPKKRLIEDGEKLISTQKPMEFGGMKMNQADEIREWVKRNCIEPARKKGLKQVTVRAGEVARQVTGGTNIPNVNSALRGKKLQEMCGIKLIKIGGTRGSTTATYTYEIVNIGESKEITESQCTPPISEKDVTGDGKGIPELIRELAKLKDDGLITAEEYEKKKKELLERL